MDFVGEGRPVLEWETRVKIAVGAARGLEYLHCKANPPVIYRDLKSANILLDSDFNPKLSDFGLAKLGPVGDNTHVSTRVMGTYGYCAPEYAMSGKLTLKSDIYSFGVVLLELITGRKAIDLSRKHGEQNLVSWVTDYRLIYSPSPSILLVCLSFDVLAPRSSKISAYSCLNMMHSFSFAYLNTGSSVSKRPEEVFQFG